MEEKYIAPKDAAEILVVKKTTVYDMIKQGRLKAVKIGKQFRIRESDVLALVGDSPQDPGAAGQESLLLCGQDMLLDHLCARVNAAEGYQAVSRSYLGSYNGLFALYQGQANFRYGPFVGLGNRPVQSAVCTQDAAGDGSAGLSHCEPAHRDLHRTG